MKPHPNQFLTLLRGVNVGGNCIVKMDALRVALLEYGAINVKTYIQSGNIVADWNTSRHAEVSHNVEKCLAEKFDITTTAVSYSKEEWKSVNQYTPDWWGKDDAWKYNLFAVLDTATPTQLLSEFGDLKDDIEKLEAGNRVIYHTVHREDFGKSTTGKLAGSPIFRQVTIRNHNTTAKLLTLFD